MMLSLRRVKLSNWQGTDGEERKRERERARESGRRGLLKRWLGGDLLGLE